MPKDQDKKTRNPLKEDGQSKQNTRERADKADPDHERVPVEQTRTGQGGAESGDKSADSDHPSQHGGVTHEMPERPRPRK